MSKFIFDNISQVNYNKSNDAALNKLSVEELGGNDCQKCHY